MYFSRTMAAAIKAAAVTGDVPRPALAIGNAKEWKAHHCAGFHQLARVEGRLCFPKQHLRVVLTETLLSRL